MADTYLWRSGNALAAASDWIDLTTGANPASAPPGATNTARFGPVGMVEATGSVTISRILLAADLVLSGTLRSGTNFILQGGTIDLSAGGAITVANPAASQGTLAVGVKGTVTGTGRIDAAVTLNGLLQASGGAVALFGAVSGAGTLAIAPASLLFAPGPVGTGLTAAFQGGGATLEVYGTDAQFAAAITGFATSDVIDIAGATLSSAAWLGGTLTLGDAVGARLALDLPGTYAGASFVTLPDGLGGTAVMLATGFTLSAQSGDLGMAGAPGPSLYTGAGSADTVTATGVVALAGSLQARTFAQSGLFGVMPGGGLSADSLVIAGTLAVQDGAVAEAGTITLNGGTLSVGPHAAVALGGANLSAGTVDLAATSSISGDGQIVAMLSCAGHITARGGVLGLFGTVGGGGTIAIDTGATLFAAGGVGAGITALFAGPDATLEIAAPGSFSATLSGFVLGDAIDVAGATLDGAAWSQGTLALTDPGTTVATLAIAGDYTGDRLRTGSDGLGGTLVTIACFCGGTRIATPTGPVAVQRLRPGDPVLTPDGPRPLCWVGRVRHDTGAAPEARPVRVRRGALATDSPCRDLLLSPEHAVLVEDVLVPAIALLDGRRVVRGTARHVSFYHIGTATHDLVLAEDVWVETFMPDGTALQFDFEAGERPRPGPQRLRRLTNGIELEALRSRLPLGCHGALLGHLERILPDGEAGIRIEGWAADATDARRPVVLEVLRDETPVARILANQWRPDLDRAGLGEGRCAFVATLPGPAAGITLRRLGDGARLPGGPGT